MGGRAVLVHPAAHHIILRAPPWGHLLLAAVGHHTATAALCPLDNQAARWAS